ncbi:MAG: hypothetical protein Kow0099_19280 [Candidatus Abyssubacteria bacterium]
MIGKEIGNYRILKELGRGGMGVVYKANQLSLNRMVAMKVLPQHLTSDPSFIKRFENEARAIARLNHPNIVQIYDVGHEAQIYYYTMEFIEGLSLDDIIYKEGFLELDRAMNIIVQVAKALQYAHSQGIVHRDIKPSNIMIDKSGRIKVTDFGLALQERTTRLTMEGSIVGTPEYMSPEQAAGSVATGKSDIYALGVVFYELLTGKVPFEGDTALLVLNKIQNSEPEWPRAINPDIPPDVEKIVRKMMARNPRARYQSCQELIQDIQRLRQGQSISTAPRRSLGLKTGIAAAALLLLLAFVFTYRTIEAQRSQKPATHAAGPESPPALVAAGQLTEPEPPPNGQPPPSPLPPPDAPPETAAPTSLTCQEKLDKVTLELTSLDNRLDTLRSQRVPPEAMSADLLLLKTGSEIRCEIVDESLDKIRIRTLPGGGLAEIPRSDIKLAVYATPEEKRRADTLRANEQERLRQERLVRNSIQALEKERAALERQCEEENAETTIAIPIPFTKEAWSVKSNCDDSVKASFEDNTLSVTCERRTPESCSLEIETDSVSEQTLSSIEMFLEVKRPPPTHTGRSLCSLLLTFSDGNMLEYRLFDSRPGGAHNEEHANPHLLVIRSAQLSNDIGEDWHEITLPVKNDAAKLKGEGKITRISLRNRLEGDVGSFRLRFKALIVNAIQTDV